MKFFILFLCFICNFSSNSTSNINLPSEFEDISVLENLRDPASMTFAPDGRLFIGERITGKLRIAKYNAQSEAWTLEASPFYQFDVPTQRHRSSGLRGFCFDPDYLNNGYVYAYYMKDNPRHNRVVRIQTDPGNPDQALGGSETLLIDLPFNTSSSSGSHNGGDLLFGTDGNLYVSTGDGWNGGDDVQQLSTFTGKLLRINPDGSIPTDNPFFNQANASYRAIYALGLRNPYTMAIHPQSGDIYINEARGTNKADVYRIFSDGSAASANFGHDGFDGIGNQQAPWTNVSSDGGMLITGGAWYPTSGNWPQIYKGNYFTVLWGGNGSNTDGRIVRVDPDAANPLVETFATQVYMTPGRHKPVMCKIDAAGNLFYLLTDYETGDAQIRMIRYTGIPSASAAELNPPPGQYDLAQQVQLSTQTPNASIYYTLDGSTPDNSSILYTAPIPVSTSLQIRAIVYATGFIPSPVSGGQYTIGPIPNIPPVADAGPDLTVEIGKRVTLNGAGSHDPDGSVLEIVESWAQLSGPTVVIEDDDETVANFTPTQLGVYTFEISVTDINGATDTDETTITVVEEIDDILDGLIARWSMELGSGTLAEDYSDNSNRGTIEGPSWNSASPDASSYSLEFDGDDDRVSLGALDLSSNEMSICFWFRADDFDVHDARFISKASGQNDDDHYWMISTIDQDKLRFRLRTGNTTTTLVSDPGVFQNNTWTHISAVYDGNTMKLYVDSVEIASTPKSGMIASNPLVDAALGNQPARASGGARPFDGLMDEARIYGRALSESEIHTLVGRREIVFPVEFAFFQAEKMGREALLSWQTLNEKHADYFSIERSPESTVLFQEIGRIAAQGNSTETTNYSFVDNNPLPGSNYYRLRQLDLDGRVHFSQTLEIQFDGGFYVDLYPNPAGDYLHIETDHKQIRNIQIFSISGQLVQKNISLQYTLDLPIRSLSPGSYFVVLTGLTGEILAAKKFLKVSK